MRKKIWAIPGFLGLPSDWEFLRWNDLKGVNLTDFSWNNPKEWARHFNEWVNIQQEKPAVLMGYSLGGRLALHALLDRPAQWQAAIIISAHPGLCSAQERKERWQSDQAWAKRFETEEWTSLMQAWNAQAIFAQDLFRFHRQEKDYQRSLLAKILLHGSLAQQENLCSQIRLLPMPILWITGGQDQRYNQLAQTLVFAHPHSQWKQVDQAGHRVPWQQPQLFSDSVQRFLQTALLASFCLLALVKGAEYFTL